MISVGPATCATEAPITTASRAQTRCTRRFFECRRTPDRAKRQNQNGTFMSFGDGSHRCPGWQVALNETRVFIDRLLRVPGIRLEREPDMHWNSSLMGYELRNAIVVCDRRA